MKLIKQISHESYEHCAERMKKGVSLTTRYDNVLRTNNIHTTTMNEVSIKNTHFRNMNDNSFY